MTNIINKLNELFDKYDREHEEICELLKTHHTFSFEWNFDKYHKLASLESKMETIKECINIVNDEIGSEIYDLNNPYKERVELYKKWLAERYDSLDTYYQMPNDSDVEVANKESKENKEKGEK